MKADFWSGRRVFVTGHTGFKGSWLSLWLQGLGAKVTGFALEPPTTPSLFVEARVADGMCSIIGDIREPAVLATSLRDAQPEIVFHLAAQSLVRYSYDAPVETYMTNVMGTAHLLDAVRRTPSVRALVNVTSDKCYDNREWVWGYRENEAMGGFDPYSSSKGCAELVTQAFRNSYFPPNDFDRHRVALASARAGNVIGGGDWAADRLIPDIVRSIVAGQTVDIRNPGAIRPWQHVLEPLSGYLTLAWHLFEQGPVYSEAWNFGPEDRDARPVQWIVEKMLALWGQGGWSHDTQPQPHEATYLKLDCSKAAARLGWVPRWGLERALREIVAWHRAHAAGADMRSETMKQIEAYIAV
ncbi:MAG: CDP-glucose 4,6-dehydratase [Proteobacteria bacterium]|nr:CDP-glucose 4,6-dehydratase [Pseudomonadota bacterium]